MRQVGFLVAIFSLIATSCATIVNGPTEEVSVTTVPPGAKVTEENTSKSTPATFVLDRNRDYLLTISKEGYKSVQVRIVHVLSRAEAGNLVSFGVLGAAIDAASGAAWHLEPEKITITLQPVETDVLPCARLNADNLSQKLLALDQLREENYLTQQQYAIIRDITIHCVDPTATDTKGAP